MRWNVLFVAATLLVAASLPSAAQISIDMNKITCGRWLGYSPEERDFVRFWISGYYNSAANSKILNYDRFQRNSVKVAGYCESHKSQTLKRQSRTLACGSERRIVSRQAIGKGILLVALNVACCETAKRPELGE